MRPTGLQPRTACFLVVAAFFFLFPLPTLKAQVQTPKEYQLKAIFLFNFVQFVEWPSEAFPNAGTPICIGILGEDPFGSALDETIRGETVRNRKIVIQRSQRLDDLKNCHLLFVSKSEKERLEEVLSELYPRAILTVSEVEGFTQRGGILNFYLEGNKIRFEINPITAKRENIKLSSQLMRLGKIVTPKE